MALHNHSFCVQYFAYLAVPVRLPTRPRLLAPSTYLAHQHDNQQEQVPVALMVGGASRCRCRGSFAFSNSHFFRHCGRWMSILCRSTDTTRETDQTLVPNSRPQRWHVTDGGFVVAVGVVLPEGLAGGAARVGVFPTPQLRRCTGNRSGLNFLPQCSHDTKRCEE
jgi:hypothetical protein